jgi:hypothetical protein
MDIVVKATRRGGNVMGFTTCSRDFDDVTSGWGRTDAETVGQRT